MKANHNVIDINGQSVQLFIKSKIQFFESKSQHLLDLRFVYQCCLSSQRYNFLKANHNSWSWWNRSKNVVYQVKDTIFWKQITTNWILLKIMYLLFIKSKIQFFESKSQQPRYFCLKHLCCLSSQRYNFLKANHNALHKGLFPIVVVYQVKDTIFWKQITTDNSSVMSAIALFIKSKIQFFESKSQQSKPSKL